jgi:hypothetical protein
VKEEKNFTQSTKEIKKQKKNTKQRKEFIKKEARRFENLP